LLEQEQEQQQRQLHCSSSFAGLLPGPGCLRLPFLRSSLRRLTCLVILDGSKGQAEAREEERGGD
jgi:hypothetical protein